MKPNGIDINECEIVDIYKADIYSLGLTFLYCLTDLDISLINDSEEML